MGSLPALVGSRFLIHKGGQAAHATRIVGVLCLFELRVRTGLPSADYDRLVRNVYVRNWDFIQFS